MSGDLAARMALGGPTPRQVKLQPGRGPIAGTPSGNLDPPIIRRTFMDTSGHEPPVVTTSLG